LVDLADEDAHRDHRTFADDDALDDFRAGADKAVVLDDGRVGLQRFQHAADADATGEMHVLADLRAGADGGPGVDHRAFVDVGADIHEDGISTTFLAMKEPRRTTAPAARRGSRRWKLRAVVMGELGRHLVEIALRTAFHQARCRSGGRTAARPS
jgi:transposase